jgi:DNA-directed RNA polymerase specialized sigma24 family protein
VDQKLLHDIARRAMKRKARWCPATLTPEDLFQEACFAILEAGDVPEAELQRIAEQRLVTIMRRESSRREYPTADLGLDE